MSDQWWLCWANNIERSRKTSLDFSSQVDKTTITLNTSSVRVLTSSATTPLQASESRPLYWSVGMTTFKIYLRQCQAFIHLSWLGFTDLPPATPKLWPEVSYFASWHCPREDRFITGFSTRLVCTEVQQLQTTVNLELRQLRPRYSVCRIEGLYGG